MRTLPEILAGCPGDEGMQGAAEPSWSSLRDLPGLITRRMYMLLTRPMQAVGEFGDGDAITPLLFFLFFSVITGFLRNAAFLLSMAVYPLFHPSAAWRPAPPGFSDVISAFAGNSSYLAVGTLEGVLNDCLFLGAAVILLAAGIWYITGIWSWKPAFSISACCLPVSFVILTVSDLVLVSQTFPAPLQDCLRAAFSLVAIILTAVTAGYGIAALLKLPAETALLLAFCWILIWMDLRGLAMEHLVGPAEQGISQWISARYFPDTFPAAGTPVDYP